MGGKHGEPWGLSPHSAHGDYDLCVTGANGEPGRGGWFMSLMSGDLSDCPNPEQARQEFDDAAARISPCVNFAAGYELPDDGPTLADVLEALEFYAQETKTKFGPVRVDVKEPVSDIIEDVEGKRSQTFITIDRGDKARAMLSRFKPVAEPTEETSVRYGDHDHDNPAPTDPGEGGA